VLTIANFNTHCGIDGWGRPFDLVSACRSLEADVIVLQETWTPRDPEAGPGQPDQIAAALGYQVVTSPLADGYRISPQLEANDRWQPRATFLDRAKSLYFECVRPIAAATRRSARFRDATAGTFGIAILVRPELPIEATRLVKLPTLSRDRVNRSAAVVDLTVDGVPLSVAGTHMAHLHQGSISHYRRLRATLLTEARPTAVLSGDMNLWGPPVRAFMRGWHRAVRGPSWPAWNPHSQIDHILIRGALSAVSGQVLPDLGSDHRAIRAELSLG
jgi:endonuclease/exonuclease/phosphatase family metal-dependent hydrolase